MNPPRGGARAHTIIDRVVVADRPDALRGSSDAGLFAELDPMLFLVDGNNLLWRAAHGPRAPFPADDGRDLTPLFRFITLLRRALGTYGLFAECVVCFDGEDAWTARVEMDGTYKANRDYEDKDLSFMGWLPEIRAALSGAGIAHVEIADQEADDVIATLAARALGRPVRILSTDRDYFQLIGPLITVVNPKSRPNLVDAAAVLQRFGVTPQQWCDFRALCGDPSDGIAGLTGVGLMKAAAMLTGDATIDTIRDELGDRFDDVTRWRELIRLRTDVDVACELSAKTSPKLPSASTVCAELGLVAPLATANVRRPRGARPVSGGRRPYAR